jgi:hypothetical protein
MDSPQVRAVGLEIVTPRRRFAEQVARQKPYLRKYVGVSGLQFSRMGALK